MASLLRLCYLGNEVGHGHFDVQLDDIGQGMELHVSSTVSDYFRYVSGMHLHEGILEAHHSNNEHVHSQRQHNNPHVESDQPLVLGQAIGDQVLLHGANEKQVE